MEKRLGLFLHVVQVLLALGLLIWSWLAVSLHATGFTLWALRAVVGIMGLGLIWTIWQGQWRSLWLGIGLVFVAILIWWLSTPPRDDRDWAMDVAHGVTGQLEGDRLTLQNVRNFRWRDEKNATEVWETRSYDLSQLSTIDLVSSVWSNDAIAHTLISFGFETGEHVVFSGEIRREKGEEFSAIGGFFKKYELVMIAADERDIIDLRLARRGERVSLYPLDVPQQVQRDLLMGFVNEANALAAKPAWYHTLLANCTTVPYRLVKAAVPSVGFDWRVLASGYVQNYLHDLGILRPDLSQDEVNRRAIISPPGPDSEGIAYSRAIRQAWAK